MTEQDDDYYSKIGEFLNKNLSSEQDIFAELQEKQRRYRRVGNIFERRPPPRHVNYETNESNVEESEVLVPVPDELVEDFAVLQLRPGSSLEFCKKSWRRLLKKFHPDTVTNKKSITNEEASVVVRRINNSYKRISHWYETGAVLSYEKDV